MFLSNLYKASKKYGFTFSFSTFCGFQIILRPNDTYGQDIVMREKYPWNLNRFVKCAIYKMKRYHNNQS